MKKKTRKAGLLYLFHVFSGAQSDEFHYCSLFIRLLEEEPKTETADFGAREPSPWPLPWPLRTVPLVPFLQSDPVQHPVPQVFEDLFLPDLIEDLMPVSLIEGQLHVAKAGLAKHIRHLLHALSVAADGVLRAGDNEDRQILRNFVNILLQAGEADCLKQIFVAVQCKGIGTAGLAVIPLH